MLSDSGGTGRLGVKESRKAFAMSDGLSNVLLSQFSFVTEGFTDVLFRKQFITFHCLRTSFPALVISLS